MGFNARMPGIVSMPLIAVALVVGLVQTIPAFAQGGDAHGDGPRFLVAMADRTRPVVAEVGKIPMLRRHVTVVLKDATLPDALKALKEVAGIELVYSPGILKTGKRVTLRAENMAVAAVLTELLIDAQVDVLVSDKRYLTLVPRSPLDPSAVGGLAGRVTDSATGYPIGSAEVFLEKTSWRTLTDTNGRYRLTDVAAGRYQLAVRRLGYAKSGRAVTVREGGVDTVNVGLAPAAARLQELVTTATGKRRRMDIANDVTTIRADSVMQTAPIKSLTDLLEHRVPGLSVQRTSGAPGDPARLRLRGAASALQNNDPIVFVDGVRVYAQQSAARSGNLATGPGMAGSPNGFAAPSPLDYIDPNSIETIEVLKGPSAATMYGQDAANGVIVVTTKKGRPGPAQWTASVERSRTQVEGNYPELYFRVGHLPYGSTPVVHVPVNCPVTNIINLTAGLTPCVGDSVNTFQLLNDPALTVLDRGNNTALSLGVSGGSQSLTYSITGSYQDALGYIRLPGYEAERYQSTLGLAPPDWMERPQHLKYWGVTSAIRAQLGPSASVSLSTALNRTQQQRSSLERQLGDLMSTYLDPSTGTYFRSTGLGFGSVNAFTQYYQRATDAATRFTNGARFDWQPKRWLTLNTDAGLDVVQRTDQVFVPRGPDVGSGDTVGSVADGQGTSVLGSVNLGANATLPVGHGFQFHFASGVNYAGTSTNDVAAATSILPPGSSLQGANINYLLRTQQSDATFGWYVEPSIGNSKLNFTTGLRLDGGGNYGSGLGGLSLPKFPKMGLSYLVSDEPWFPFRTLFQSLRVRVAYGRAGRQPDPTNRLRLYGIPTQIFVDGQSHTSVELLTLGNTKIRPERTGEFEGGIEADLFDSRLTVILNGYRKTTDDALVEVPLAPSIYGDGVKITKNIGVTRNTGLDVQIGGQVIRSGPVTWGTQLMVSQRRDELISLGLDVQPYYSDPSTSASGGLRVAPGYPLFGRWSMPILGYADANGNGVLEPREIQLGDTAVYVGSTLPDFEATFNSTIGLWHGAVSIDAGFTYQDGLSQRNEVAQRLAIFSAGAQVPGVSIDQQAATGDWYTPTGSNRTTDYNWIQTVNTLRFNSVSIRYAVPTGLARRLGAQSLSIALQGSNLGLWTNYRGLDPNVNAFGTGNNVTDTGVLPQPRLWQLRVHAAY